MRKICWIVLCFIFFTATASAALTTHTYTLDIDIPDPGMITETAEMIGGVEFQVFGGDYGVDWDVTIGDAVPQDSGEWIFESFGTWNAVYDDYDWSAPDYAPLGSGNVLTITSATELSFSDLNFYDFAGASVSEDYFNSQGFTQGEVPIPGSLILFGSGLLGFLGLKRRKE